MSESFATVKQVVDYVKPRALKYRQYPSLKEEIIEELKIVFNSDVHPWGLVIEYNKFVASFHDAMGKKGRVALKKLLYELDYSHYKDVDFDVE